ncbi:methyltransferase regulatory domain-containing protein [Dickeya lacustris]|uniref:protein O-GlcNAc transferase n=1 Tax=Dickeya lacustris TaxID=2259638 RepID=A0ABY8G6K8_9GAMM|nr:methyltransferase regulatory domain-containing protein [Dickeya lacustris]WFN55568.1 methyltransferase regulatory domain-containing protein [Dickeya lacustris]
MSNVQSSDIPAKKNVISPPIVHTAPYYLQAMAYLYGIKSAAPETARILEIGTQDGGNLFPFAIANPKSHSLGIDIDTDKIEKGNALIRKLNINNIELFSLDLDSLLSSEPGDFDYIIVHGVFSLLGGEVRDNLLQFCKKHLTPDGLICYGYNTFPGWKTGEVLRDAIQLHSSLASDEKTAQESARAMLTYLSLGMSSGNTQYASLNELIGQAEKLSDTELALYYMQGFNQPCYFVDFYAQANNAGLAYVGDAKAYTELAEHYGNNVSQLHKTICPENKNYLRQQYLDFAVNRSQRFSILVSKDREDSIYPEPDLNKLATLNWAGNFRRVMTDDGKALNVHKSGHDETITTDSDLVLGILDLLGDAWPNSLSVDQIAFNTSLPEKVNAEHKKNVIDALTSLFIKGLSCLYPHVGNCVYRRSKQKSLSVLPGIVDGELSFNLWHDTILLDEDDYKILKEPDFLIKEREASFYQKLFDLRNKGVFFGTTKAWRDFYQKAVKNALISQIGNYIQPITLYTTDISMGGFWSEKITAPKLNSILAKSQISRKVYEEIDKLTDLGFFDEARNKAREVIKAHPESAHVWYPFVNTFVKTKDFHGAIEIIARAISLNPFNWGYYVDLVICFWKVDQLYHGLRLIRRVLRCDDNRALAWDTLALLLNIFGDIPTAFICMEKALAIEPNNSNFISHMGSIAHNLGSKDGIKFHRKTVELMPEAFHLHSNLLFALSHDISVTAKSLFDEHLAYGRRVHNLIDTYKLKFNHGNAIEPNRRLRIGFVSGDLGEHPVTNFIRPIWDELDKETFSIFAYSCFKRNGSEKLKMVTDKWHDVDMMSDVELAKLINNDEIDILIDLSGHTAYNRLPVFALKPAPIQMSWIGYPGTTGLPEVDYYVINTNMDLPDSLHAQFIENLIFLPFVKMFEPSELSPDVNELPLLSNKYITFGSLNRPQKINDEMLKVWAEILCSVPNSKMLIGYMPGQELIDIFKEKMNQWGVSSDRLDFRIKTGIKDYLKMHHEIDMLLDTFPYTGGTTTNHALWMGVPTLTLIGETLCTMQGLFSASGLGVDDFAAYSIEEYKEKAIKFSNDPERLSEVRRSLRTKISNGIVTGVSQSFFFEKMLTKVWEIYCKGEIAHSFSIEKL